MINSEVMLFITSKFIALIYIDSRSSCRVCLLYTSDTARKLEYDNISGQQNEVKKKLNMIKKIPKIELVWRVVWCVVFMVIFSFFAFGLIRLIFLINR